MGAVLGEVTVRMNVSGDFYGIPTKMRLYPSAHALKKAFIVGAGLMHCAMVIGHTQTADKNHFSPIKCYTEHLSIISCLFLFSSH